MPMYEYVCAKCGHEFELLRSRSEKDSPVACSRCGKNSARRKVSACFMRSRTRGGSATRLGGSSCASCTSSSCASCGVK